MSEIDKKSKAVYDFKSNNLISYFYITPVDYNNIIIIQGKTDKEDYNEK